MVWDKAGAAVRRLGRRAILVTGPATPHDLPAGVRAFPYLPYSTVFPRAAAVVHQAGIGTLAQGYLEGSNVKLVDEMVNLMVAQRAYEASVKVVQASDEMLGMVNNLHR